MKKISIITGLVSFAIIVIWIFCALVYCAFNGFPKHMPDTWNTMLAIPFLFFLLAVVMFCISMRKAIIEEINYLINQK